MLAIDGEVYFLGAVFGWSGTELAMILEEGLAASPWEDASVMEQVLASVC